MPEKDEIFTPVTITKDDLKTQNGVDLTNLYERAHIELTLQQTKRDQIITLFFSIFSLLVPLALSLNSIPYFAKGFTFLVVGIIGIIFSVIVIRYRIYKEVYWLCCETITCMMNVDDTKLTKSMVQTLYYNCLKKKGKNYCIEIPNDKGTSEKELKWDFGLYVKKNIFSSETLHYVIIVLLTTILLGLGAFLSLYGLDTYLWVMITVSVAIGLIAFIWLFLLYFYKCQVVYSVLKYKTHSAFNKAFEKAWFLHNYVEFEDVQ